MRSARSVGIESRLPICDSCVVVKLNTAKNGCAASGRLRQWAVRLDSSQASGRHVELVVRLGVVGAVIAGAAQVCGEAAHVGRRRVFAAHVAGAERRRVHARDEARAAWSAHGADGEGAGVTHAFGGQPVEVGRAGLGVSVAPEVGARVLAGDPQNVGPGRRGDRPEGRCEKSPRGDAPQEGAAIADGHDAPPFTAGIDSRWTRAGGRSKGTKGENGIAFPAGCRGDWIGAHRVA
jgi:hypothetical protein